MPQMVLLIGEKNVCVSENSTELTSTLKAVAGAGWLHWLVIDWY